MNYKLKQYLIGLVLILSCGFAWAETAVVVGANSGASVSKADIKAIYLGKNKSLKPVDQKPGSAKRVAFIKKVVGKSESQFKAFWSQKIFSGKGTPPPVMGSDSAVKRHVASNPNAIGFIDASAVDGSVKVVYRVK